MRVNNFDFSSTGVNLELAAYYDLDLSYIQFNENFSRLDHIYDRFGGNSAYTYLDWGNIPAIDPSEIEAYYYTKSCLIAIFDSVKGMKEECAYYNGKPFSKCTKAELVDYLESELPSDESYELYRKHLSPRFDVVEIRGYSQGDYAEIIVPDHFWTVAEIEKPSDVQAYFEDIFTKLFYDTPIYCRLIIDDEEFYFDEYIKDQYEYDKEELIAIAEKHITHDKKDLILSFLADRLPADLEHK